MPTLTDRILNFIVGLTLAFHALTFSHVTLWLAAGQTHRTAPITWAFLLCCYGVIVALAWQAINRYATAAPADDDHLINELTAHRQTFHRPDPYETRAA